MTHIQEMSPTEKVNAARETVSSITSKMEELKDELEGAVEGLNIVACSLDKDVGAMYASEHSIFYGQYTDGFKVGDTVYYAQGQAKENECTSCDGTGRRTAVIDNRDREVTCPDCDGRGKRGVGKEYVIHSGRIEAINVRFKLKHKATNHDTVEPEVSVVVGNRGGFSIAQLYANIPACKAKVDEFNARLEIENKATKR